MWLNGEICNKEQMVKKNASACRIWMVGIWMITVKFFHLFCVFENYTGELKWGENRWLHFNQLNFSQFVLAFVIFVLNCPYSFTEFVSDARVVQFEQTAWIVLTEQIVCRHSLD